MVHWNHDEAAERACVLRNAGYEVDASRLDGSAGLKPLRDRPPHAVVIDLSRIPSHGRDVALALRSSKATRGIPLVFVEGAPDKVSRVREALPDAAFTTWSGILPALKRAIEAPPSKPIVPTSALAGYSNTPLPKKLGIKAGYAVALVGAPDGFEAKLGKVPDRVVFRGSLRGRCDLVIWFARSRAEVEKRVERLGQVAGQGGLWIAWPKKTSGVKSDLSEPEVRRLGLAVGLVDYKIAAIDEVWSGLRFAKRRGKE